MKTKLESGNQVNSPLKIVREVYDNLPFNRLLGLKVEFLDIDRAGFGFTMKNELIGNTIHGILHGGVIVMRTGRKVAVTRMELKNEENILIAVGTGTYIVG